MERIEITAPAKINLGLVVERRRPDGYHDIRSIMQTVSLADRLSLKKIPAGCRLSVDAPDLPDGPDNLAYRAWEAVRERVGADIGVEIRLNKVIPAAAGLAGGSADAAAVIVGLNQLYELGLTTEDMCRVGGTIGSDVPFCVTGGAALTTGRGEKLEPLPGLPDSTIVLLHPHREVSTAWAYANLRKKLTAPPDKINYLVQGMTSGDLNLIAGNLYNSFDETISHHIPIVNRLKLQLMEIGALGACLTGSGPTVFGVFEGGIDSQSETVASIPGELDTFRAAPYPVRFRSNHTE
ncbi:4-(cytidine 5'-diphospho)-2-C-methyl-D-erythritol kinase [candidate division KSB1 bacterium]